MMTSDAILNPKQAYVWVWLPHQHDPVVAGLLVKQGRQLVFNYGRSYLERPDAIPLYAPELPLQAGLIYPLAGLDMPSCLRDAAPDAWGRRVLLNRLMGAKGPQADLYELDELTCLLASGSDRIGALDFQHSATHYEPRQTQANTLDELLTAADQVERGIPLAPDLSLALQHGTSLGGARPKAMMEDGQRKYIAKFSSSNDLYSVVKAEFIAMRLAARVGLNVAEVKLASALGKDVLLIERFDRVQQAGLWQRRAMVSALTLLGLDEMMAAYASYEKLAEIIRHRFTHARETLRELFGRIVFNVLCGNTDDHARNHAAFWDGQWLTLTPAYDICPQPRTGQQASQAMLIHAGDRRSQLATCLNAAATFMLTAQQAQDIVDNQVSVIQEQWASVCQEAQLSAVDSAYFWQRQFLNPFVFA